MLKEEDAGGARRDDGMLERRFAVEEKTAGKATERGKRRWILDQGGGVC